LSHISNWGWQLYLRIPDQVLISGVHLSRFLRNLTLFFPVLVLRFQAEEPSTPFSVLVAGELPWAEHLPHLLFPGEPKRSSLGQVPLWQLPRFVARWASSVDLVVVRVDRVSSQLLFGKHYLRVPELVDLHLELPQDIDTLYSGNRNRNLKNDLRRVQRNQLSTQISHHEPDLAEFYHRFHVPFVRQRFGRFAWPHNLPLLRGLFRQGGLIWALQNGQRLAGCVYGQRQRELSLLAIGTADGDDKITELGAQVALFHALVKHARDLECDSVNLGASRPLLSDGNLRFKRKWGARLVQREASNDLLLHWERLDKSTSRALYGTALVFFEQGHLAAVGALESDEPATSDDVSRATRFLRIPGVHRLHLCSSSGFEPRLSAPDCTCLIDLTGDVPSNLPAALRLKPFAETVDPGVAIR
jgi:hypothetical protein